MSPPKVFISYAHEDRIWCDRLQQHLGGLRHQGRLAVWADDQIMAGDEWDPEIHRELDEAAIIVLIVTPAFLGSKFCQTVELRRAMERHGEGSARVIPIIADHCHWTSLPISKLQARPQDENRNLKPLIDWQNANVPLTAIAKDIDRLTRPSELSEAGAPFVPAPERTHLLQRRRTFFVGRDEEKRKLQARLAGGGRAAICAVAGMGGVGKTELALQVASTMGAAAFPDGILTVNLMGTPDAATTLPPLTPEAAMRDVLTQLDPANKPPQEPKALARAYANALVGKQLLFILDNARDEDQVRDLVPPEPVALLVTSRKHIEFPEGTTIDLDTLTPADALALLREEIGDARAIDDATLARFAELCGYLPVALLAIAGTLKTSKTRTPDKLLVRLEADRKNGLTKALDRLRPSVDALAEDNPDLAHRFARLAVFAGDFSIEAAAYVWETDEDTACDGLEELLARSLLLPAADDSPEPRFRLHDLIREIATERLGDDADADAAALRHATFYRDVLGRCDRLYLSGNDAVLDGLALFDRERAEIVVGQSWAAGRADSDDTAARLAGDYPIAGICVILLRLDGRTQIVWLEAALAACCRLGDRRGEGNALGNLGLAWRHLGEPRKAIEFHEQNLVIAREIGNRRGEGTALGNLGLAWADLGETRKAIEYYEQRLVIAREIGDRRGEGAELGNLGNASAALGKPRKALDYYERWLVIAREIGDRSGEGIALGNLGIAWKDLGEPREAIGYFEQSLEIAREIGNRRGEGTALGNLGLAWKDLGEPRKAIEHYEQHLVIAREIGDRRGEGTALGNLGVAQKALGKPYNAIEYYEQQFVITREIGDRRGEGNGLGNLGNAWLALGEPHKAIYFYEQQLVITREIGDRRGEGNALWNMSCAHEKLDEREAALASAKAAFIIFRAIEHPDVLQFAERLRERRVDPDSL